MDGVARSRRVTSAREAKGKQWNGREAVKVWKRSRTSVVRSKPLAVSSERSRCVDRLRWKLGARVTGESVEVESRMRKRSEGSSRAETWRWRHR